METVTESDMNCAHNSEHGMELRFQPQNILETERNGKYESIPCYNTGLADQYIMNKQGGMWKYLIPAPIYVHIIAIGIVTCAHEIYGATLSSCETRYTDVSE